jgi:heparan-sulfate lyase
MRFVGLILLLFCFLPEYGHPIQSTKPVTHQEKNISEIELLLSRLKLDGEGLAQVKSSMTNPEEAAAGLLEYYRKRTSIKHQIDRRSREKFFGSCATDQDIKYANDALRHIFISQRAYPAHFCDDDIDWNSRPVPDMEWVWQLNRMYFWNSMGKVYWHTGDEKYAKAWCEQVVDWIQKNPNDSEHRYAWRSIEAGIRGYNWTGLYQRFLDSPSFTPEVLVAFLNSCYDHAEYLMTKYRTRSNWGLMEAEGMAFIAITFPEFKESEKWRNEAFCRLNNEINIQVYPEGHQRELAIGYHLGCIGWFLRTYELVKLNHLGDAFPDTYLERIEKMCEVPMKLCLPDGTNVPFGDAWAGTPGQHSERFLEWSKLFERDDFLYMATEGKKGSKPEATAYALKESGLYSMRSSWDKQAICLVLKCGPDGGGHCQPDNGTFDLYAGGRNLMPDGGSYIYSGNPEGRAWFRQTKVHQTLTLNSENSEYAPELLLWEPGDDLDVLIVENAGYDNLTHRRAVFFVNKRYFVIVDEAIGSGSGDIGLHFQLAPTTADFDHDNFSVNTAYQDGWNVLVRTEKQDGLKLIKEEGQVSFEYTKKEPRPAFGYHIEKGPGDAGLRFITLVAPYEKDQPELKIKVPGGSQPGSSNLQLEITENNTTRTIGYSLQEIK